MLQCARGPLDCLATAEPVQTPTSKRCCSADSQPPDRKNPASSEILCVLKGGEKALEVREGYREREENETARDYKER